MSELTADLAARFARIALGHVTREYPNKLDHVLRGADDVRGPRDLHPIFYGSFDWHSCVHGYWLLCTLLRRFPALPAAPRIRALLDAHLTEANVAAEVAYAEEPAQATFERPYGWAWLLMLQAELERLATAGASGAVDAQRDHRGAGDPGDASRWARALEPLALAFVGRFLRWLPNATYPVRVGTHASSAFALTLALEYCSVRHDERFGAALRDKARAWYGADANCPAWEPGGEDFLSPALAEAACMRAVLPADAFAAWLAGFLPDLEHGEPATLFLPATVSDRTDGRIAHLDGLNFSRAWCMRALARTLPDDDPRRARLLAAAAAHLRASLPHVTGDYMGEHWLATFAVLALSA